MCSFWNGYRGITYVICVISTHQFQKCVDISTQRILWQHKTDQRGDIKKKDLCIPLLKPFCSVRFETPLRSSLSPASLNIYLRRTNRSTYVCLCNWWNQPLSFLPLLWRHCYDRPLKYMENQNALTPTHIQLKHSARLFQRVSEWMESSTTKMWFCPTQDRMCRSLESTPWPWVAEYVKHLERHGKCTMIVVTTIVRFSTEESLESCESMIFTKRVYSFQCPICQDKTVLSDAFKAPEGF